jgi:hypothetical protein
MGYSFTILIACVIMDLIGFYKVKVNRNNG